MLNRPTAEFHKISAEQLSYSEAFLKYQNKMFFFIHILLINNLNFSWNSVYVIFLIQVTLNYIIMPRKLKYVTDYILVSSL